VCASTPTKVLMEQAQLLTKQEKYSDAAELYQQILDSGEFSESLYYNLGTAYVHESKVPQAILYLRKSLKLQPGDVDTHQNLKIARNMVQTEIIPIPEFFLTRYWKTFSKLFSSTVWGIIGLLCLIILGIGFYSWLMGNEIGKRKKAFYTGLMALLLFLISIGAGWTKLLDENSQTQAVLMEPTSLLLGADERSEEILNLSPGVELEILDEIGDFYKVKLFDQELGWINKEVLALI